MDFLNKISRFFKKAEPEPIVTISDAEVADRNASGKISIFNEISPGVFNPKLLELGYELPVIRNHMLDRWLWSTTHFYNNQKLGLTVEIQQSPYYSDYGFSVFLLQKDRTERILICNVPHEKQDKSNLFIERMKNKIFLNAQVLSMLKGEAWEPIQYLSDD